MAQMGLVSQLGHLDFKKKTNRAYDVNKQAVLATRRIGRGYASLRRWCGVMNIPKPMANSTFDKHTKSWGKIVEERAKETMKKAVKHAVTETGSSDLAITGDCAWSTRGFNSNLGLYAVMSVKTDQILDIQTMSKQCTKCTRMESKKGTSEYDE